MSDDKITTENVYATLGRHLCENLTDHKGPIPDLYMSWDKDEEVWIAYPSSNCGHIGATRTIVISKRTGEILADAMVGE